MTRLVIALVLGLLLAGCGKRVASPGAPPPNDGVGHASATARLSGAGQPGIAIAMPDCSRNSVPGLDTAGLPAERSPIPDGFTTAWVLRCRIETRDLPGKGKWTVSIVERADTSAAELVAELRKPSDPRSQNPCTLEMVVPPYFLLVDASGKAILPSVPADSCGKPKPDATKPLDSMPFRLVSETPVGQVQSPQSAQTGCPDRYKDLIHLENQAQPAPARQAFTVLTKDVRICVYQGAGDVGTLTGGRTVGNAAIVESLDKAGPAAPCSAPHTRFATVSPAGSSDGVTVELDGCHRLLRADHTLGQLDAAAAAAIAG